MSGPKIGMFLLPTKKPQIGSELLPTNRDDFTPYINRLYKEGLKHQPSATEKKPEEKSLCPMTGT